MASEKGNRYTAEGDVTMNHISKSLVEYLGGLTITQGRHAGKLLTVLPWQKRFCHGAFADDVESAGLSVGRGNGKTTMVAGLGAAALDGPLAFPRGETVVVASSFDQSRIAFEHTLAFLRERVNLKDRSVWRVWDSMNAAKIQRMDTGAMLKCIGSDPRRAHGLAPTLVIADEPAQWEHTKADAMLSALRTGLGKQPHSLFVALGTRPADEQHWFAKMLDGGGDYAQSHAARVDDPKFQRRTWERANPSLKHMPDLLRTIKSEAKSAKIDPAMLAAFEALRLNLGTSDTVIMSLLESEVWLRIEGEAAREGRMVWGIDLGTTSAQSAVAAYWPNTGNLEVLAAFPREPSLAERGLRDGVGRLYVESAKRGELITTGGEAVSISELLDVAFQRFGKPHHIVADRWREGELIDCLKASGIPKSRLSVRGMGFMDGSEDVRSFRRACLEGRVTPRESLVLRSAMREARTVQDPAGNSKLAKGTEGARRLRAKDDAVAASILAVGLGERTRKTQGRRLSLGVA